MSENKNIESKVSIREIEEFFLAKKEGEALERITRPFNKVEKLGLGYFETRSNIAISTMRFVETALNEILETDISFITDMMLDLATATGSREFRRAGESLETIGQIGQFNPMGGTDLPSPEAMNLNK